jgi:kynurenine formamidase
VVFLSHVNDPATSPVFPGDPEFTLTTVFTVPADGFYLQYVKEGEHTGTHYSAPCHFHEGERCADQLAARDFVRPAVVVDVRRQAARDADYQVTVADLRSSRPATAAFRRGRP